MDQIPLARVPDVVLGRDGTHARPEAMAILAASSHPEREALLARVLESPGEDRRYRVVAAITLGRIDTKAAEAALLRNLRADQPAVAEVLKSLGRIGDEDALRAIESLQLDEIEAARGPAVFAAALISYRLGLAGHDLPLPDAAQLQTPPDREVELPIEVRRLDAAEARVVLEALRRYPYGNVAFDPGAVTRFYCAGEVNVICTNREFAAPGALATATARKALMAVGALQSPETGDYSPSYLVLTHPGPGPGAIELVVPRCGGAMAMAGTGRIADDRAEFELRSVRRPGARAIFIRATVTRGVVDAAEARSSTTREPPRIARHVVVGPA